MANSMKTKLILGISIISIIIAATLVKADTFFVQEGGVLNFLGGDLETLQGDLLGGPTTQTGEKALLYNWDDTTKTWIGNENVVLGGPTTQNGIKILPYAWDDTNKKWTAWSGAGAGSGGLAATAFSATSPLAIATTTTTVAYSVASGYSIPLTASTTEWATAYGWGNHASAGYLKADGTVDLTGDWTISSNSITLTGGTLTANTLTDGTASISSGIVNTDTVTSVTDNDVSIDLGVAENTIHIHPGFSAGDNYFQLYSASDDANSPQLLPSMDGSGQIGTAANTWGTVRALNIIADTGFTGNLTGNADTATNLYGLDTFGAGSLLYASGHNAWGILASSTTGKVLWINSSGYPEWTATSTLGVVSTESDTLALTRQNLTDHFYDPTVWVDTGKTLPDTVTNQGFPAIVNGFIYLFGSCTATNVCNLIWRAPLSDPTNWSNTGSTLPGQAAATIGAIIGDNIFLFGGNNNSTTDNGDILAASTSNPTTWIDTGANLPENIYDAQVAIIGDSIYLFGGANVASDYRDVIWWASTTNPTSWSDTGRTLPLPLNNTQLAIISDTIYMFGGSNSGGATTTVFTASVADPLTWTAYPNILPGVLKNSQLAVVDDYIYLFGGQNNATQIDVIYKAQITDPLTWVDTTATLPAAVANSNLFVLDNNIYLVGGQGPGGEVNYIFRSGLSGSAEYSRSWKYALDYTKELKWYSAGTVNSVAMTVPTGLSVSGSPVTTSGTLAVSLSAGYEIPLTASTTIWNTDESSFSMASTSWAVATSTRTLRNSSYAFTLSKLYCKTDTGTALMRCGDGTNWTEQILCSSSGQADDGSIANGTFTAREDFQCQVGTSASSSNYVTGTATFTY